PPITDGAREGATQTVRLTFPPLTTRTVRITIEQIRRVTAIPGDPGPQATLPVSIAEAGLPSVPRPAMPASLSGQCRGDLIKVDGTPVSVRITGATADARAGLEIQSCSPPLRLSAGSHTLQSAVGLDTAVDVDRMVLSSDPAGNGVPIAPLGAPLSTSGTNVRVTANHPTSVGVQVHTDGSPFWLVLGQSVSAGWKASVAGGTRGSIGPQAIVDGFANGWLVTPRAAGTMNLQLQWTPQRQVWIAMGLSALAVAICIGIVVAVAVRRRRATLSPSAQATSASHVLADEPVRVSPLWYAASGVPSWATTLVLAGALGVGTLVFSRIWIALVAAGATMVLARVPRARWIATVGAPVALIESRLAHTPELAWLALAFLAVDLACGGVLARASARDT
ncbi:MAG: hypothetical protein JOZ99_06900, partial [Actinobacteria bacterium]|nr:hypothetical protein [Actinomycetota bacterium]